MDSRPHFYGACHQSVDNGMHEHTHRYTHCRSVTLQLLARAVVRSSSLSSWSGAGHFNLSGESFWPFICLMLASTWTFMRSARCVCHLVAISDKYVPGKVTPRVHDGIFPSSKYKFTHHKCSYLSVLWASLPCDFVRKVLLTLQKLITLKHLPKHFSHELINFCEMSKKKKERKNKKLIHHKVPKWQITCFVW